MLNLMELYSEMMYEKIVVNFKIVEIIIVFLPKIVFNLLICIIMKYLKCVEIKKAK